MDFEGYMDAPPSFVGIYFQGEFRQIVLTENLKGCEGHSGVVFQPLREFLSESISLAVMHNVKICGFTTREMEVFLEAGLPEIENHYFNVHKALKKWFNQNHHATRPRPFSLDKILEFFNYPLKSYGFQQATQRIRSMETQLIRHNQDFTKVTPVTKSKWTRVLNYNRQDVEGMMFALKSASIV